ncbi:MAG TPA: hypothetical protein VEF04_22030 [Blastocatellia bacterium]|nr:hypothetical protein [Blastocatellia bacterium]
MGQAGLGLGVIVMLISLALLFVSVAGLTSQFHGQQYSKGLCNALNTTLLSLGTGSAFLLAYSAMLFVVTIGFADNFVVIADSSGRVLRRNSQRLENATAIVFAIAQGLSAIAPLLLPLLWIELAGVIFDFRRRGARAVHIVSTVFCGLVCFVQIPLYVLSVNDDQGRFRVLGEIAPRILYVVDGFIILVNLIAALRIVFAIRAVRTRPQSEANDRFLKLLRRVSRAAVALIINYVCAIGLIIAAHEGQKRD